jgi:tricorn protease
VYYIELAPDASAGAVRGTLMRYKLSDRKAATFATEVADYAVSADGKKLVYRTPSAAELAPPGTPPAQPAAPNLFLVDADKAPPDAGKGKLAVSLSMWLDPKAEFAQIFHEGWRDERDYLYVPNMHGADWPKMKTWYGQFLPDVQHRADLNYLLDMMGAEIAIGHSYVRGGAMPEVPAVKGGLLGADFAVENGRYRITKIYDNESWNPDLKAPLAVPGVNVSVGDYVLAVNGEKLEAPDNLYRLLDGTANKQTVLTVSAKPSLEGAHDVTVIPVANEQPLRTRAWVESNRQLVEKLSGGKLAYVYLPNTGQPGYSSFNRYYFAQQDKPGAVIDERYNGGGSAADYMIEVMQRKFDGYFNNVAGERVPFTSPAAGIWGPKVMIANEMSGSGGDYLPYMFHSHHVGTLVGKRTWGGLVHTADTPLFVDGGSMIAPRGGFFAADGHWAVENEGVTPDVDVENWPKDVVAGHDPQLEKAVEVAMDQLKEHPVVRLTKEPAPPTWGERKAGLVGGGLER